MHCLLCSVVGLHFGLPLHNNFFVFCSCWIGWKQNQLLCPFVCLSDISATCWSYCHRISDCERLQTAVVYNVLGLYEAGQELICHRCQVCWNRAHNKQHTLQVHSATSRHSSFANANSFTTALLLPHKWYNELL